MVLYLSVPQNVPHEKCNVLTTIGMISHNPVAFTRCLCITLVQHINFLTLSIEWLRILLFYLRDDV